MNYNDGDDSVEIIDEKENIWGETNEQAFIELMIEEVKKGNRTTSTFSKTDWRNIIQGLKEKVGRDYTHSQLKNKYHGLRASQRKFKALIKESGIGYNSQTGEVSATEEGWESLKKVHSLATRFRKKGSKEFSDLCFIFGDTTATGNHQHASTKSPSDSENESHETKPYGADDDDDDDVTEVEGNGKETNSRKRKKKSKVITPKKKRVRRNFSHALENALLNIGEQSKRKNDLLEKKIQVSSVRDTTSGEATKEDRDFNAMNDCLSALDMLDLEGIAFGKAVQALHDSALYRKLFLRMSDERKKDWALSL